LHSFGPRHESGKVDRLLLQDTIDVFSFDKAQCGLSRQHDGQEIDEFRGICRTITDNCPPRHAVGDFRGHGMIAPMDRRESE
jgi:hypothetical protein